MKYQVCFHAKKKKKCYLCTFCSKNFFIVKWFGISVRFTVYIIRGTLHDCLEKGNSNSNVILTTFCSKKLFNCERVWYFIGLYSVYNKENITGLLGEIYFFSLLIVKKIFPLLTAFTCGIFLQHSKTNFVSRCGHVISSI